MPAYKGVYQKGDRFQAFIGLGGKRHCLGTFGSAREAALAYDRAAVNLFGLDADTNLGKEAMSKDHVMIDLDSITVDTSLQVRAHGLNQYWVEQIRQKLEEDPQLNFDPIRIFEDGAGTRRLSRGFHRLAGYLDAGRKAIPAEIHQGGYRDAQLDALGSNAKHALQLSSADLRRKVEIVLADPEWRKWSVHEISRRTGVSRAVVAEVKEALNGQATSRAASGEEPTVTYTRAGKTQTMKTGKIGKKPRRDEQDDTEPVTEALTDEEGGVVPDHLTAVFLARDQFDETLNLLGQVKGGIKALREQELGVEQRALVDLDNCRAAVKHARPHAVCPHCRGEGERRGKECEVCRGKGWVNKGTHDRYAESMKR